MAFELPVLPYSEAALEPYLSAKTLKVHHGKHHGAYVATLNELIENTEFEGKHLEEIIQTTAESVAHRMIFNNAGQHWNHSFFWQCMRPMGGGTRASPATFGSTPITSTTKVGGRSSSRPFSTTSSIGRSRPPRAKPLKDPRVSR